MITPVHGSRKKWILKIKNGVYLIAPQEAGKSGSESYTLPDLKVMLGELRANLIKILD